MKFLFSISTISLMCPEQSHTVRKLVKLVKVFIALLHIIRMRIDQKTFLNSNVNVISFSFFYCNSKCTFNLIITSRKIFYEEKKTKYYQQAILIESYNITHNRENKVGGYNTNKFFKLKFPVRFKGTIQNKSKNWDKKSNGAKNFLGSEEIA